jgi:hypothetical protein
MRDLHNNIHAVRAISPAAAVTDNTAIVSQIADRKGFDSLELVLITGNDTDTDATFTVLIEESDASDMTGAVAVDDIDLLGTEALASYTFADDNEPRKIGYVGNKRYVRATITPANNTGNAFLAGLWLQGHPAVRPTANPPI